MLHLYSESWAGPMTLDDLRNLLEGLTPGHFATISNELYAELFSPSGSSAEAQAACSAFAQSVRAAVEHDPDAAHVKLVKVAGLS